MLKAIQQIDELRRENERLSSTVSYLNRFHNNTPSAKTAQRHALCLNEMIEFLQECRIKDPTAKGLVRILQNHNLLQHEEKG